MSERNKMLGSNKSVIVFFSSILITASSSSSSPSPNLVKVKYQDPSPSIYHTYLSLRIQRLLFQLPLFFEQIRGVLVVCPVELTSHLEENLSAQPPCTSLAWTSATAEAVAAAPTQMRTPIFPKCFLFCFLFISKFLMLSYPAQSF